MTIKCLFGTIICVATFGGAALAAHASDFNIIDTDASGGLSLSEVQAVAPDVTEDEFVNFDIDGSGELSEGEYEDWKASKSDGGTPEEEGAADNANDEADGESDDTQG
ncbi:MAG: hypothetical protein AAFW83_02355 [Pseudomonadota bacterium]